MIGGSLLPHNSSAGESALAAVSSRLDGFGLEAGPMWDPDRVPGAFLEWLAAGLSVDDWDPLWSPDRKRSVIAASVEVHRLKGTRAGVQLALDSMGYGPSRIVEDRDLPRYGDPGLIYGGAWVYGPSDPHWADYWVELLSAVPRRDADRIRDRLSSVAPVRCRLRSVELSGAVYAYGDGNWVYGDDIAYGNVYFYEVE